jgi:hypothetical protein
MTAADKIDDVTLMIMADGALAAGQQHAVAAALSFDAEVRARFDAFVASAAVLAIARDAAPPEPVPIALAARIARPPMPATRWMAAAAVIAVAAVALSFALERGPSAPAYIPAGGEATAAGVPEGLTLPDGEVLAAQAAAALPGACRLMVSSDQATRAVVCRSIDGSLQTVLVAP